MDVAEYIKRKQKQNKQKGQTKQQNPQNTSQNAQNANTNQNPQASYNKYSKMNEEQLMQELFKVGSISSGQVSPEALDNFYNSISARLTPEQAARMKDLISQLKRS